MEVDGGGCEQHMGLDEVRHESEDGRKAEDAKIVTFKLLSPMGGESLAFTMVRGQANRDVQEELSMHIKAIFRLCRGVKEAFEKSEKAGWEELPWSDADQCPLLVKRLNKCIESVVVLWSVATRSRMKSMWWESPYCTSDQTKLLSFAIFNRVVKNAKVLNKCYKSFSSQTYGETSFDQMQIILDKLQLTEKDVFVDLGSGVGHLVTYAAAYTLARKCVGIEINDVPAKMSFELKKQFEGMMSWYGKKYQHIDLVQGDFTSDEFRNLITKEATVIYLNNFAYEPDLMFAIKQMIMDMNSGVRIVCTKSLLEERREGGEGGPSHRSKARQNVDIMLDCEELPHSDAPVSWGTGKGVQFLLFTVNHDKMEKALSSVDESQSDAGSTTSLRADSAEAVVQQEPSYDREILTWINEIHARRASAPPVPRAGGGRIIRLYPDEEASSDEDDGRYSKCVKWSGLKYTDKAIKEQKEREEREKREKRARRAAAAAAAAARTAAAPARNVAKEALKEMMEEDAEAEEEEEEEEEEERGRRVEEDKQKSRGRRSRLVSATSSMATTVSSASTEEKKEEEELFPFGKVAASGHTEEFDKEEAPEWAVDPEKKITKHFVAVYAPHHSIFEEDLENLPKRRSQKVERFAAGEKK